MNNTTAELVMMTNITTNATAIIANVTKNNANIFELNLPISVISLISAFFSWLYSFH